MIKNSAPEENNMQFLWGTKVKNKMSAILSDLKVGRVKRFCFPL